MREPGAEIYFFMFVIAAFIFTVGWKANDSYRWVNNTLKQAQACEVSNCLMMVETQSVVAANPPKLLAKHVK